MILTDFKLYAIALLSVLTVACTHPRNGNGYSEKSEAATEETNTEAVSVTITLQTHRPYCGGAPPTPEMMNGIYEPLQEVVFYISPDNDSSDQKEFTEVKTDINGQFTLDLIKGRTYYLFQGDKLGSEQDFIEKYSVNQKFYENRGDDCLIEWMKTPDFSFELTRESGDGITLTQSHKCFTGANPCLVYNGPMPP